MAKVGDLTMPCPICQTRIRFPVIAGQTTPAHNLPGHVNLHLSLDKSLMRRHVKEAHGIQPASSTTPNEETRSEHTPDGHRRQPDR